MQVEHNAAAPAVEFSTPRDLFRALSAVWAADTASPSGSWSVVTPAKNHCSITSLIVQDYFGGDILCTRTSGGTHFYNRINGVTWDLTVSQFAEPEPYDNTLTTRAAALGDTSEQKYTLLRQRLLDRIEKK